MTERTPTDYALEFAEYMAKGAEQLIEAVNALAMAEQARDEGDGDELDAKVDEARQDCTEFLTGLRNDIHQFRTRRDRAARAAQSSTVGEREAPPPGATHYQPHQKAYYKRLSATEWMLWADSRQDWMPSPGSSDSAQWVTLETLPPQPAAQAEPVSAKHAALMLCYELEKQPASSYQTAAVLAAFKVYRAFESIEKHGEIRQWVFDVAPSNPPAQGTGAATSPAQARSEALEEAANVCREEMHRRLRAEAALGRSAGSIAASACEDAIRALKDLPVTDHATQTGAKEA